MPAKSQAQYRFMEAVAHGMKKPGLSSSQAKEYVQGQNYSSLPKFSKLKKKLKGN